MQVNPINIVSSKENKHDEKQEKLKENDECAAGCGLCCICYLLCLPLFSSLQ